jgi:hypothetical protein
MSQRKATNRRISWSAIEQAYVSGEIVNGKHQFPTMANLAAQYGCSVSAIASRSSKQDWKQARSNFMQESATKSQTQIMEMVYEQQAVTNVSLIVGTVEIFQNIKIARDILDEKGSKLKPIELKKLTETMETTTKQLRLCLNMAGDKTDVTMNLEVKKDWKTGIAKILNDENATEEEKANWATKLYMETA